MHVVTIANDKKQISNNIFVLTERQESLIDNLRDMQNILEEYTLDHNVSSFIYSILVIFHKSIILVSCHQKNDGISFYYFFKQTYSGKVISVVLMYIKHTESVLLFYEKLVNAREEVDIILEEFNLNPQDSQVL